MRFAAYNLWVYSSLVLIGTCAMRAEQGNPTVTVMTQNMDAGTDLGFALAYLNTATPTVGIDLTYEEILQGNFAGRAAILAQEIATAKPHMVSLQESTLWSTGQSPVQQTPLFDQLQLLLDDLAGLGQDYSVVAIQPLTSIALPMSSGVWLGFLDDASWGS